MAPILISISVSLKSRAEVLAHPDLIPNDPSLAAYTEVLTRPEFQKAFLNSVIVAFGSLTLSLLLSVPAAYALARFGFRGRHLLLLFLILPLFVPKVSIMAPLYQVAVDLGVVDAKYTLVVVFSAMLLPLAIWLMLGYFQALPPELEEAAAIDGASQLQMIMRVVLPLALPALITVAVLSFREAWNEFELVLALTRGDENRTLPYELFRMNVDTHVPNEPGEAAFALITILPLLFVFTRIEKHIASSITSGSVK